MSVATASFSIYAFEAFKKGSSGIWSDIIVRKKKPAEQFVYLNNHKLMYKHEQQFSISCVGALQPTNALVRNTKVTNQNRHYV